MPFYEYECSACKFYVEALQKISDEPLKKCPSCKKQTLKRLMSAPVFRLKGGGWYETDFKSEGENKRNLVGEDKESSKSESKDETKTDSTAKPEGKSAEAKTEAKAEPKSESKTASKSTSKSSAKSKPKVKAAAKKK
jgi:putative FmdB family regulatory protein